MKTPWACVGWVLLLGACTTTSQLLQEPGGLVHEDTLGTGTCHGEGVPAWPDVFPSRALAFTLGPQLEYEGVGERGRLKYHCFDSLSLHDLKEGPLLPLAPGSEVYRFTWLRSFLQPVVIRVEHLGPVHSLHVKMGDDRDGPFMVDRRILLTPGQWQELRRRLDAARFWSAGPFFREYDQTYVDGATWLLEGARQGRYQALHVQSPRREGRSAAFRVLCLYLLELSGLSIPDSELY